MADARESILARLVTICGTVTGVQTVIRNGQVTDAAAWPCVIILDADEVAQEGEPRRPGPQLVTMTPEIYVVLEDTPEDVGGQLNTLRARLLKAILNDATLKGLTGANGAIRYEGCATGLARGRSMVGEMGVSLSFTYPFIPSKL